MKIKSNFGPIPGEGVAIEMKVYIVLTEECYGGEKIKVFSTEKKAKKYRKILFESFSYCEYIDVYILETDLLD